MVATDKLFAGSIPEFYDRRLVPLIFEPYALEIALRVAAIQARQVLETAAGTGVVTRALAAQLPPQTGIVATDLNEPMLKKRDGAPSAGSPHPMAAGRRARPPLRGPDL